MTRVALVGVVVLALLGSGDADARCNRHQDKRSAAIGRALKPGAEVFLEGRHPALRPKRVRFVDAGKKRLKRFKRVVLDDGITPDLSRAWVRAGENKFKNVAPLAGCKLTDRPATRDYSRPAPKPRTPNLVVAGYCREGKGVGRLADADEAWTLHGTALPFCTPLTEGAFRGDRPPADGKAPWTAGRALWLVARLPEAPERSVEVRVQVSVWSHADARCNACEPPPEADCTAATTVQTRKRTAKVTFDAGGFATVPVFELSSMLDERAEHVAIEGVLWTSGEDLARTSREIYWSRCD